MTDAPQPVPARPAAPTPAELVGRTVAIIGGTGDQGRGLGRRWADAGLRVLIGSRTADRARDAADRLRTEHGVEAGHGTNDKVAAAADLVLLAVPYAGHADIAAAIAPHVAGKVVIDCVNPLGFDKQGAFALTVPAGSAAQEAAALMPDATVVAAFHHVSAVLLLDPTVAQVATDVMVLGDDRAATDLVQAMAAAIPGMRGIYAGRLRNAHQVEALTANLISVNRRYKAHAGLRVTDV